ncbi:methyltransferase domain-containing protein [Halobaculum sp. EA56]|uniref:methyltransferase domain-containing protein n=1 Tax=Halobaculum sp. EA56 TaxID=3421648 RepID=UPI003EBB49A1
MPVVPGLLERLAFRANLAPSAILDVHGAASLHAAALAEDLGVFAALDGSRTAADLARELELDREALETLLDALAAVGYVARDGDEYRRTRATERWLTAGGEANLAPFVRFWTDVVLPYWRDHAARAVREGDPGESLYEWLGDDEDAWATTQAGFRSAASLLQGPVADALGDVAGASVLDLGGGHGAYAVELAERGAAVTLVDHPAALGPAREAAAAADADVRLVGGDYLADDLWERLGAVGAADPETGSSPGEEPDADRSGDPDEGYDLILLFNVLHGHDPDEAADLLDRAAAALAPGGRLAVLDQFDADGPTNLAAVGVALIDLTYLVTLGSGTPDEEATTRWIDAAGLARVDSRTFRRAPGVRLLVAERA